MDELKKLLENVSDTYDDFVGCVLCAVKHDDEDIRKALELFCHIEIYSITNFCQN